jgi:hypothetical protein
MVQIICTYRIEVADKGQPGIGFRWHYHEIVSVIVHWLAHHWHPVSFEVAMEEGENILLLPGRAINIDKSV